MTRVLVMAGSPITRAGLAALVSGLDSVIVVGASSDGDALAELIESTEPDVLLWEIGARTDLPLPLTLTPDTLPRAPATVLLADAPDPAWVAKALRVGAAAVLPRSATAPQIDAAIAAAANGLITLARRLSDSLLPSLPRPAPPGTSPLLTPRELEVLGLIAEGLGNKMVAARLDISEHTVKTHVASIFIKLGVSTRAEAVATGARLGMIML